MNNNNKIKYPCLFIFIIEQSGSMSDTIDNVKIALTKLTPWASYHGQEVFVFYVSIFWYMGQSTRRFQRVNSIIAKKFFFSNIIGFGSNYKVYNKQEKNTKKNLKKIYKLIKLLSVGLGGTDLSLPLNYILKDSYSNYKDINLSK